MANKDFEIKSSEIRQLLNTPPTWMARWGTVFMLLALVIMAWVSYALKFPEIITADVTISTSNPPVPVVAKMPGVLSEIFIEEGQSVIKGQEIALSSNDAVYRDIKKLQTKLEEFNPNITSTYDVFYDFPNETDGVLILGEIQEPFDALLIHLRKYDLASQNPEKQLTAKSIRDKIKSTKQSILSDKKKLPTLNRSINVHNQLIEAKQNSLINGSFSRTEYDKLINERDLKDLKLVETETRIKEKEIEVMSLNQQLRALNTTSSFDKQSSIETTNEIHKKLLTSVENWKRKNLITAPAGGVISFYDKQADRNKYYKPEEAILAILSNQSDLLEGTIDLPVRHIGRIQEGQQVYIRLHSFPYQEFGKVAGIVKYKSKVPKKGIHTIGVELTNRLKTTFEKEIPEEQELVGLADIITSDKSLFQTVFQD